MKENLVYAEKADNGNSLEMNIIISVFHQFPHFFCTLDASHLRRLESDHNHVVRARLWSVYF